ncbi:hypothetical protein RB614_37455 [Phytohabitans sp. ZYX-F-186]|uniref:Uncharacterized protein n=1 Tax=Phytohabitans maris TaxID=3071409 RepID=A0ABU0ZT32_9ACTN|nr:hypothetical protein [Phytohabitans sp. ZYX-F-186]MDQ7910198.1 hypothetical protein [Phytohabitans sp. ZYX-F-186]
MDERDDDLVRQQVLACRPAAVVQPRQATAAQLRARAEARLLVPAAAAAVTEQQRRFVSSSGPVAASMGRWTTRSAGVGNAGGWRAAGAAGAAGSRSERAGGVAGYRAVAAVRRRLDRHVAESTGPTVRDILRSQTPHRPTHNAKEADRDRDRPDCCRGGCLSVVFGGVDG